MEDITKLLKEMRELMKELKNINKTKPETNPQISKNKNSTTSKPQTQPQNTNPSETTTTPKMTGKLQIQHMKKKRKKTPPDKPKQKPKIDHALLQKQEIQLKTDLNLWKQWIQMIGH